LAWFQAAVFWRGITAPTNIDYHGWLIIKEPPPSPCQWIRVSGGYYVRQCIRLAEWQAAMAVLGGPDTKLLKD
jgi:hypothetical protein